MYVKLLVEKINQAVVSVLHTNAKKFILFKIKLSTWG
jgi:hypothetical protein